MRSQRLLPRPDDERLVAFGKEGERSCAELRRLALALASQLSPGDELLLLCEDRYYFAAAWLGALEAKASVFLPPHRGSRVRASLEVGRISITDGLDSTNLARSIRMDEMERESASVRDDNDRNTARELDPEEPLLTLFTSGTTGLPRAWRKTSRQLLGEASVLAELLQLNEDSRVVSSVSPQHIYGLLFGVVAPLLGGASFLRRTSSFVAAIETELVQHRATCLISVPAHLSGLWTTRAAPHNLLTVSSGAQLENKLLDRLSSAGADVIDVLGSSETGGFAFRRGPTPYFRSLGPAELTEEEDGSTTLRSPFLAEPEVPFSLADALVFEADGSFRHQGRLDDVVKVGGKRVALGEIAAAAGSLPGVRDAVCLAEKSDSLRAARLELYVVAPGYTENLLLEELRKLLDPVLVPRRIHRVESIPRQENGKLLRTELMAAASRETVARFSVVSAERGDHGATVRGSISAAHPRFRGHFPEEPLLPAVSELHDVLLPAIEFAYGDLGFPRQLSRWKLMAPLVPGANITITLAKKEARVEFAMRDGETLLTKGSLEFAREEPS